jgi:hypothetical protein
MELISRGRSRWPVAAWVASIAACAFAVGLLSPPLAQAQEAQDARKILKAMSDYVTGQRNISFAFDSTIEVVTRRMQKIQFNSSGDVLLTRPDKLRATRTGGYADVELVFDGKTATLFGKNRNAYAQVDATGSVDQLIDRLRDNLNIDMPGADLLLSTVYQDLSADIEDGVHIGRGVIEGVECDHLAFRNDDVDWQLWVEVGAKPIPRKYVITTNSVSGGPQYSLVIRNWKTDVQPGPDAFLFKPTSGAHKVEIGSLHDLDEVPPGRATTTGAR